jgi:hypothetical protein
MKKLILLVAFGFVVISACLVYLVKSGIALRSAPQIKPSVIAADFHNVPQGLFLRLYPDLQPAYYFLWGVSYDSPEVQKTIFALKDQYEKEFRRPVQILFSGPQLTPEAVRNCASPCWLILASGQAHELGRNELIETHIKPHLRTYTTLTWIDFDGVAEVPERCQIQKFLDLECLKLVSVREVQKKMKDPRQRYFFMRKYLDHDFFLFVQTPRPRVGASR